MSAGGVDPGLWATVVLVAAFAMAMVRLVLWQRSAALTDRAPRWRIALLLLLQLAALGFACLTLFPPDAVLRSGTLMVITRGGAAPADVGPGDTLVALPEAGPVAEATRTPDLATALRRFPQAASIRILGEGLTPRDQAPLPVPVDFDPPARPRGLIDLTLPGPVAPGAVFSVGGQIGTLATGTAELVDPAGVVVDRRPVAAGQRFVLSDGTRAAGLALFDLRLRDAAGRMVERIAVPVETREQRPPRVLVLAGAPGPETKFLGRWAEASGILLNTDIDVGAGVRLGDPPVPLTAAALGELDLVVIDDRRWEAMGGGGRSALSSAVEGGLGLLLRPTAPLSAATRRDWAALGASLTGGDETVPLRLDPPAPTRPADAAQGEDDRSGDAAAEPLPELARRNLTHEGPETIGLVRDGDGVALASWRVRGRGRVGVWTVADSYALVLTGRADRYGEIWSELFSAIARTGDDSRVGVEGLARVGSRVVLCGLTGAARISGPEAQDRVLLVDPATGDRACAATWPTRDGWHRVSDGRGRETLFYAHPADAGPSLAAFSNRQATLALAGTAPPARDIPDRPSAPGSPWPWFAGLLTVLAMLWWFERQRSTGPAETPRQFVARTLNLARD